MTEADQARLEARLGYRFKNSALLRQALTPPSSGITPDNQRMEYLGDAVLQFCVSRLIFQDRIDWDEGAMSKLRGMLVCTESLRAWAGELELVLERGPRSPKKGPGGRLGKPLADALEALLAAIYLDHDSTNLEPVMRLVSDRFLPAIHKAHHGIWEAGDAKTTLQERAAIAGLSAPIYELVDRTGPDHEPVFSVRVRVGPKESRGTAGTLKGAQTEAARNLLKQLD